jgi:hypothetical protein
MDTTSAGGLPAKTDPEPPPTGLAAVWEHIKNWPEGYLCVPLSLFLIWVFGWAAYLLSGRKPQENSDWLPGLGGNWMKCVLVILACTILCQASGEWMTPAQKILDPNRVKWNAIVQCVAIFSFSYLLSH